MLTYTIRNYVIEVFDAKPNYIDFINQYDVVYVNEPMYEATSVVGVKIYKDEQLLRQIAFGKSGGATGIFDSSIIVDEKNIVCCCSDSVFCISVPELDLLWNTQVDSSTAFQIIKYKRDYIVHGEQEISRLSEFGEVVWRHSGADIFTTPERNEDDFIITNDYILATDWDGRKYKFDFDGNIERPGDIYD